MRSASLLCTLVLTVLLAQCGGAPEESNSSAMQGAARLDAPAEGAATGEIPPPLDIKGSAPAVVFLSDSIGAGLHLAEHQSFPRLLQARLAQSGQPFRLINSCESGRTTSGGVSALEWVLRSKPQLVVIALGGNDGLRGTDLDQVRSNLRKMIERARAAGAKVLLLGVLLPPNYGEYGDCFNALYPELADELGTAFLPFYMEGVGGVPEMNLPDGLHPTPAGHERLADNVLPALTRALQGL